MRLVLEERGSPIDGKPIACVTSDLSRKSNNTKTGPMSQEYIYRTDIEPHEALKAGKDTSVCGSCPARSKASGGNGFCYVVVWRDVAANWKAYKAGNVEQLDLGNAKQVRYLTKRPMRLGTYGNPDLMSMGVLDKLASILPNWTGYTHRWREADSRYAKWMMASVETAAEALEARELGWRWFRNKLEGEPLLEGEINCPYPKVTCSQCQLCSGLSKKGKPVSIAVEAHGMNHIVKRYREYRDAMRK